MGVFDGGHEKNRLAQAKAKVHEAELKINVSRDQIARERSWGRIIQLILPLRPARGCTAPLEATGRSTMRPLNPLVRVRNLLVES